MTQPSTRVDFDKNPPMPVDAYEQTVRGVNIGYDLTFQLTGSFLRALGKPNLDILVVGAGGGAEIERFLPQQPGWKMTGVDPSQQMLELAQAKVDRLKLADRVTLVQGTVEQLETEARFDAATCLYVLHFLPDDAKLSLLRSIKNHLRPGGSLYLISGVRPDIAGIDIANPIPGADFQGAWQQYGEAMGMPAERMASTVAALTEQMSRPQTATAARVEELAHEAGFTYATPFCTIMGSMYCWVVL